MLFPLTTGHLPFPRLLVMSILLDHNSYISHKSAVIQWVVLNASFFSTLFVTYLAMSSQIHH